MALIIKPGVSVLGLKPEILIGLRVAEGVLDMYGYDTILTSGTQEKHGDYSRHYLGMAVDIRSKHIAHEKKDEIFAKITARLGDEFKAIWESKGTSIEHFHISYKPRTFNA